MSRITSEKAAPEKAAAIHSGTAGLNERWTVFGVCIFLAAIIWMVFGQTWRYDFINFDDNKYVYEDAAVTHGLTLKGVASAFSYSHTDNWVPLTTLSHMLDCQLYGLNAGGHHLTNVLLHTATTILLFLLLRRMTGFLWRSAFVAAVFAIHPLRVESVAWISERKDVLGGLFFMLTIWAFVRYARRPWSPARYGLVLLLFALGLMSTPILLTLPFVLLLLDYWPLQRFNADLLSPSPPQSGGEGRGEVARLSSSPLQRLPIEKIPLLMLSLASCIPTVLAERPGLAATEEFPLHLRIENALVSYVTHIGRMFYPAKLAAFYPYPGNGLPFWEIISASLLLAVISLGVFFWQRKQPYLLAGWLWYLIMLAPHIGLIQVGSQARADHHTYLPQIGLSVLLTWLIADLSVRLRHRLLTLAGLSAIVLAALIFCARTQTFYWRNSESLWTHTLACTSNNDFANNNLGEALLQKGRTAEAIAHFQKALEISPGLAEAHSNLGIALFQKGRQNEAIAHLQKALEIRPDFAGAYNNLGNVFFQQGRLDEAIANFQKALQINPGYAEAHKHLGDALFQKGRLNEAIAHYQKALQLNPNLAQAHNNLGIALAKEGQTDKAISEFQEAIRLKPDYAEVLYNLGNALAAEGRFDEAIEDYRKAIQLDPNRADTHLQLGAILGQAGRTREAIVQYRAALKLDPNLTVALNNLAWILAASPDEKLRNGNEAVRLAQHACDLTHYREPLLVGTLADAYAEAGHFPEAVATAETAEQLATRAGLAAVAAKNRRLLELYRAGKPYHEPPPPKP